MDSGIKEEIADAYLSGYRLEEIAELYDMSVNQVREVLGDTITEKDKKHITEIKQQKEAVLRNKEMVELKNQLHELFKELRTSRETIKSFRASGCALARCPNCGEIMDDAVLYDNGAIHYRCDNCGYVDTKDKVCKDKCCREGLGRILLFRYQDKLEMEGWDINDVVKRLNYWVKYGGGE